MIRTATDCILQQKNRKISHRTRGDILTDRTPRFIKTKRKLERWFKIEKERARESEKETETQIERERQRETTVEHL